MVDSNSKGTVGNAPAAEGDSTLIVRQDPGDRSARTVTRDGTRAARGGRVDGRSRPDPIATRRKILEAAVDHLVSDPAAPDDRAEGLINSVVRRSGLTKGALYHHFNGQAALLTAVVEEYLAPIVQADWLDPLSADEPRWPVLLKIFDAMVQRPGDYLPAVTLAALLSGRLRPSVSPERDAMAAPGRNGPAVQPATPAALSSAAPVPQAHPAAAALDELFAAWVEAIASAIAEIGADRTNTTSAATLALAMLSAFTGAALAARTAGSREVFAGAVHALTELLKNSAAPR